MMIFLLLALIAIFSAMPYFLIGYCIKRTVIKAIILVALLAPYVYWGFVDNWSWSIRHLIDSPYGKHAHYLINRHVLLSFACMLPMTLLLGGHAACYFKQKQKRGAVVLAALCGGLILPMLLAMAGVMPPSIAKHYYDYPLTYMCKAIDSVFQIVFGKAMDWMFV